MDGLVRSLKADTGAPEGLSRDGRPARHRWLSATCSCAVTPAAPRADSRLSRTEASSRRARTWPIPELVSSFRDLHPNVRFELRKVHDDQLSTVLACGEVDFEISTVRLTEPGLRWHGLMEEPLQLALPATIGSRGGRRLRWPR